MAMFNGPVSCPPALSHSVTTAPASLAAAPRGLHAVLEQRTKILARRPLEVQPRSRYPLSMDTGGRSRRVRPALEPLVRQLAELPEDERCEVVAAAQESAARRPVLSWDAWESARGLVSLGGDAVADCDRLYDGS